MHDVEAQKPIKKQKQIITLKNILIALGIFFTFTLVSVLIYILIRINQVNFLLYYNILNLINIQCIQLANSIKL